MSPTPSSPPASASARRLVTAENNGDGAQPIHNGDGSFYVQTGANSEQHIHAQTHITLSRGLHPSEKPSRRDIIDWLEPRYKPDFLSHHEQLLDDVAPGTGVWLLESAEFQAWKNPGDASQILWMHGISGSGKTMLASIVFDSLMRETAIDGKSACAYLYFQDGGEHQPMCADIFNNLFKQLLDAKESNDISTNLKERYKESFYLREEPSRDQVQELFIAEASTFERLYLVIDALDSCQNSDAEKTQDLVLRAISQFPRHVRVLMTSRTGWSNGQNLRAGSRQIHVTPDAKDVGLYIRSRIQENDHLRRMLDHSSDSDILDEVVERVIKATGGVFLLAKLHMDNLIKQVSLGAMRAASKELPGSVADAINSLIAQIKSSPDWRNESGCGLARHALTWIIHAITPLKEAQVLYSYAIQHSHGKTLNREYVPIGVDLTSACSGLVILDPDTRILRLVHESLHYYLQKHDMILPQADLDMGKKCLSLLHFDRFYDGDQAENPVLEYAATHWITHIQRYRTQQGHEDYDDTEIEDLALEFLRSEKKVQSAFQAMGGFSDGSTSGMTGLHAAVYFDSQAWAENLIQGDIDVNKTCTDGQTALHWATTYSRHALVDLLIRSDADPSIQDTKGDTPLHLAVKWSTVENCIVISTLVAAGAAVDLCNKMGYTALEWATRYRPLDIAWDLIKNLRDVDKEDGNGWSPLRLAMRWKRDDLVYLLMDKKADVNLPSKKDGVGWTPLGQAAQLGLSLIVSRLLDAGADVNFQTLEDGHSPLWLATKYGHLSVVQTLIRHGARVNDQAADGTTPLIQAVKERHQSIVLALLEKGARQDIQDNDGLAAFNYAIRLEKRSILWLLVTNANAADLALRDKTGLNGLDEAIERGDLSVAWLLCENGAKPDTPNNHGLTALHRAAGLGHKELVRLFLDRGVTIDKGDNEGRTALYHAVLKGREEVARLLVSRQVGLNSQADDGSTALILATRMENEAMLKILLNLPCGTKCIKDKQEQIKGRVTNPDLTDREGIAALHFAVCCDSTRIVKLLGEGGAYVDIRDRDGRTPLMMAAQMGKEGMVSQLLLCKADARGQDYDGRTALDYAENAENSEVKARLVRKLRG